MISPGFASVPEYTGKTPLPEFPPEVKVFLQAQGWLPPEPKTLLQELAAADLNKIIAPALAPAAAVKAPHERPGE